MILIPILFYFQEKKKKSKINIFFYLFLKYLVILYFISWFHDFMILFLILIIFCLLLFLNIWCEIWNLDYFYLFIKCWKKVKKKKKTYFHNYFSVFAWTEIYFFIVCFRTMSQNKNKDGVQRVLKDLDVQMKLSIWINWEKMLQLNMKKPQRKNTNQSKILIWFLLIFFFWLNFI